MGLLGVKGRAGGGTTGYSLQNPNGSLVNLGGGLLGPSRGPGGGGTLMNLGGGVTSPSARNPNGTLANLTGGGLMGKGFGTLGLSERTRRFIRGLLNDATNSVQTFDQVAKEAGAAQGIKVSSTGTSDEELALIRAQVGPVEITSFRTGPVRGKGIQQTTEAVDFAATVQPPPPPVDQQKATFLRLDQATGRPVVLADGKELLTTWTIGSTAMAPGQSVLVTTINGQNVMETPEQAKKRMEKGPVLQEPGKKDRSPVPLTAVPWMQMASLPVIAGMWRRQVTQNGRDSSDSSRRLHRQYLQIFSLDGAEYVTIPLHYGGNGTDRIVYTMTGSWSPSDQVYFVPPPDELTNGYAYGTRTRQYSNEFTTHALVEWVFPVGGRSLMYVLAVRSGSDVTTYSDFSEVEKSPRIDIVCDGSPTFYQMELRAVYEPSDMAYSFTPDSDRFFAFVVGPSSLRSVPVPAGVQSQMAAFLPQWQNSDRTYGFPVEYNNTFDDYADPCNPSGAPPTSSTEYQTVTRQRLGSPLENWGAHFKLRNMCFPDPSVGNILQVHGAGMYAAWREGAAAFSDLVANPSSYPDPDSVITAYMASDPVPGGSVQIENTPNISASQPVSHWSVGYRSFSQVSAGGWTTGTNVLTPAGSLNPASNANLAAPSGMTVTFTGDDQKLLMAWDWGNPGYCRAQALSLGFGEADLTP